MRVTIAAKSGDFNIRQQRAVLAQYVLEKFADELTDQTQLAFFDDEDPNSEWRKGARGFFEVIDTNRFDGNWPKYLVNEVFGRDNWVPGEPPLFDHLIYLRGPCSCQTALVMTFSHELQHFIQYSHRRQLWVMGQLVHILRSDPDGQGILAVVGLRNWPDIPHEREARIVEQRVATQICGADAVRAYIEGRIRESVQQLDREDWEFRARLDPSISYDLEFETKQTLLRMVPYLNALPDILQNHQDNTYYKDIVDLLEWASPRAGETD
jgi:hypothetical protein